MLFVNLSLLQYRPPPPHVLGNQENILLQILRLVSLLSLSHLYEKILASDVKEQK